MISIDGRDVCWYKRFINMIYFIDIYAEILVILIYFKKKKSYCSSSGLRNFKYGFVGLIENSSSTVSFMEISLKLSSSNFL